ncbi:MAG: hypothetical protein KME64_01015 [Scytonematopsis contorta HA4267-MV1]|jgi:exonuclease VII large subunit|nr:hypothetical protein [Scytonematopsis contorta HA4267-MV1]
MSEITDENKPSQMIRVPTPLISAVRELSRLHRQGHTNELLQGLDELILALDWNITRGDKSQSLSTICERLDNLESQLLGDVSSSTKSDNKRIADLEEKVAHLTPMITKFAEAIINIQNNLNNQPRRGNFSRNNSYQGQAVKLQPLTEDSLSSRLGVSVETIRKEKSNQPPPLFVAWSKRKDTSGIGWEFNQQTGLYHPVN